MVWHTAPCALPGWGGSASSGRLVSVPPTVRFGSGLGAAFQTAPFPGLIVMVVPPPSPSCVESATRAPAPAVSRSTPAAGAPPLIWGRPLFLAPALMGGRPVVHTVGAPRWLHIADSVVQDIRSWGGLIADDVVDRGRVVKNVDCSRFEIRGEMTNLRRWWRAFPRRRRPRRLPRRRRRPPVRTYSQLFQRPQQILHSPVRVPPLPRRLRRCVRRRTQRLRHPSRPRGAVCRGTQGADKLSGDSGRGTGVLLGGGSGGADQRGGKELVEAGQGQVCVGGAGGEVGGFREGKCSARKGGSKVLPKSRVPETWGQRQPSCGRRTKRHRTSHPTSRGGVLRIA
mmetsp:Transcript_65443/g.150011  ORF Transcript_65443/g.150011 Transcript_65443/m.150011 type:complete len:340 (-) Transcript_65443:1053-2072(-)